MEGDLGPVKCSHTGLASRSSPMGAGQRGDGEAVEV